MNAKKMIWAAGALLAASTFAETTKEVVDGQYVITVPEGEGYALSADDVTTIGTQDLVKRGKGTLYVSNSADGAKELANYTGTIYIYEGVYQSQMPNGLGSASATTYVDGGTFRNTYLQGGYVTLFPGTVHFKGTGHNDGTQDLGAFQCARSLPNEVGFASVVLDGDTLFTLTRDGNDSSNYFSILSAFDMNGHTLTVRGIDANSTAAQNGINFPSRCVVSNRGAIVVDHAFINPGVPLSDGSGSLRLTNGAILDYVNVATVQDKLSQVGNLHLILDDGATISVQAATANYSRWGYNNLWHGPVTVNGRVTVTNKTASWPSSMIGFVGKVSGSGGFDVKGGAKVILFADANDFTGDITVEGVETTVGTTVNGVASGNSGGEICGVYGAVIGTAAGSIPTNAGQRVSLKNAHLIHSQANVPEIVSDGTGVLFSPSFTAYSLQALTGCPTVTNGWATLTGPWKLRPADIAAGKPLTVIKHNNSQFFFGTTATFTLTDEAATEKKDMQLTKDADNVANVVSSFTSASGRLKLKARDGDLWLVDQKGFLLIIR